MVAMLDLEQRNIRNKSQKDVLN
ncbi:hypothetical protein SAMN03159422_05337 [Agrobacterium fabrum]|nr:hypothetical protein SAMN03159422_05337 [Agrobacterium fabrum]SES26340.1 hypothetical protein SAMN03159504_05340 [Agrobacterium fabrum]